MHLKWIHFVYALNILVGLYKLIGLWVCSMQRLLSTSFSLYEALSSLDKPWVASASQNIDYFMFIDLYHKFLSINYPGEVFHVDERFIWVGRLSFK